MKRKNLIWLMIGGVVFAVLAYAGFLIFLAWPISDLTITNAGVFGDSFGFLTSLFSGLAFVGLIITIVMQRDELALQRQELHLTRKELSGQRQEMQAQNGTLKVQRFENTFFKMLDFLEGCRNDIYVHGSAGERVDGRIAIKSLYEKFTRTFLCRVFSRDNPSQQTGFKEECKTLEGISAEYNKFYVQRGDELGQYYRTLYNILKLVDRADFIDEKSIYTNLIRAQLSRYELLLLFYNCLSVYGKEKMAPLVKKYKILKYLEKSMLPKENQKFWDDFNI